MVNEKQKGTCETCRHYGEDADFPRCDVCARGPWIKDEYEPLTNADRIRRMTDAGLAELLSKGTYICERTDVDCGDAGDFDCAACRLKWLRAQEEVRHDN